MEVHNPGRMDFYGQYDNQGQAPALGTPRLPGRLLPQTMLQSNETRPPSLPLFSLPSPLTPSLAHTCWHSVSTQGSHLCDTHRLSYVLQEALLLHTELHASLPWGTPPAPSVRDGLTLVSCLTNTS